MKPKSASISSSVHVCPLMLRDLSIVKTWLMTNSYPLFDFLCFVDFLFGFWFHINTSADGLCPNKHVNKCFDFGWLKEEVDKSSQIFTGGPCKKHYDIYQNGMNVHLLCTPGDQDWLRSRELRSNFDLGLFGDPHMIR